MRGSGSACYINNALYTHFLFYTDWLICVILVIFHDVGPIGIHVRDVHQAKKKKRCNVSTPSPVHAHNSSARHTMFDISIDESGKTYSAPELVKDKSEAEIGNARKRKYFCVTCVGVKHPVSLKTRRTFDHVGKKARNYTALAWFSHHGGGKCGAPKAYKNEACSETATHWQAKHILCEHIRAYRFETSKCSGCTKHTNIEDGAGAAGRVEYTEKTSEGKTYRFDAVLMRNNAVSSVLEVWATHETSEQKREYCLKQGYTFAEFHAAHVVEMHEKTPRGGSYKLENLKIREFECKQCEYTRKQDEIRVENSRLREVAIKEHARKQNEIRLENARLQEEAAREHAKKQNEIRLENARLQEEAVKKKNMLRVENERLQKVANDENARRDALLLLETRRRRRQVDSQFYETSTGAETRIIELQNELHTTCMSNMWMYRNFIRDRALPPYELRLWRTSSIVGDLHAHIDLVYNSDAFRGFFDYAIEYRVQTMSHKKRFLEFYTESQQQHNRQQQLKNEHMQALQSRKMPRSDNIRDILKPKPQTNTLAQHFKKTVSETLDPSRKTPM